MKTLITIIILTNLGLGLCYGNITCPDKIKCNNCNIGTNVSQEFYINSCVGNDTIDCNNIVKGEILNFDSAIGTLTPGQAYCQYKAINGDKVGIIWNSTQIIPAKNKNWLQQKYSATENCNANPKACSFNHVL